MLVLIGGMLLAAGGFQVAVLRGLAPRRLIGDEAEYLATSPRGRERVGRQHFLRPPLLHWLGTVCYRPEDRGESCLRAVMTVSTTLTVALTASAGWYLGGEPVALLAGLLLLMQPERFVLGCHLWPDNLLALLMSAINLLLLATEGTSVGLAVALGGLCAAGALTRIDFLVVPPLLVAALWGSGQSTTLPTLAWLLGPSLLVTAALSLHNRRRYGVLLPDTTWAFNLMVARREQTRPPDEPAAIDSTIRSVLVEWQEILPRSHARQGLEAMRTIVVSPLGWARALSRRLLTMIGPDTFLSEKVLQPGWAYPEMTERVRRVLVSCLHLGFAFLLTLALAGQLCAPLEQASFLLPSLGLALVPIAVHARTRYRLSLLPALALLAAAGLVECIRTATWQAKHAVLLLASLLFFWSLLRIASGREIASPGGEPRRSS